MYCDFDRRSSQLVRLSLGTAIAIGLNKAETDILATTAYKELCSLERFKFERGSIVEFGPDGESIRRPLKDGKAFETSGCSDCNLPYYNERPGGTIYNYARPLAQHEIEKAIQEIWNGVEVP